jgi:hypothetical protein
MAGRTTVLLPAIPKICMTKRKPKVYALPAWAHDRRAIWKLLESSTAILLSIGLCACAGSHRQSSSRAFSSAAVGSSGSLSAGYLASDGDNDIDDDGNKNYYLNPSHLDSFVSSAEGRRADPTERLAITRLLKRYYAAAAADNGPEACTLLDRPIVSGLDEGQTDSSQGDDTSCAVMVSQLFKQQHASLVADDVPTMSVIGVRIKGAIATATLGFMTVPVAKIRLEREMNVWRLDALLGTGTSG